MWDFVVGMVVGIYLGTYYDFRPSLEALLKWGTEHLPRSRTPPPPPAPQSLFSVLTASKKSKS